MSRMNGVTITKRSSRELANDEDTVLPRAPTPALTLAIRRALGALPDPIPSACYSGLHRHRTELATVEPCTGTIRQRLDDLRQQHHDPPTVL